MGRKKNRKHRILRKVISLLMIFLILFMLMCFLTKDMEGNAESTPGDWAVAGLELPAPIDGEEIIKHTGYTLSYNEEHELPSYAAYELTREEVLGNTARDDNFREDPYVRTGSATLEDYRGSGYDRGHLAPAADFKWSEKAMDDTFYMSNMAPQDPSFNRGIWADLEAVVRNMAYDEGRIYVVTGPVLTDGPYETIGDSEVSVPKEFYKVILKYEGDESKAIGFLLENKNSKRDLESFAKSVDEIEEVTGIDFFPKLDDAIEEKVEKKEDVSDWTFRIYLPDGADGDEEAIAYVSGGSGSALEGAFEFLLLEFNDIKLSLIDELGLKPLFQALGLI